MQSSAPQDLSLELRTFGKFATALRCHVAVFRSVIPIFSSRLDSVAQVTPAQHQHHHYNLGRIQLTPRTRLQLREIPHQSTVMSTAFRLDLCLSNR